MARLLSEYSTWLSRIQDLELGEVYSMKPLVDGKTLQKELGKPPGNWLQKALDVVVRWQLRNPTETDPRAAIEAVKGMAS